MMSLQKITANIWIAKLPLRFLGLSVGTRMTIVRLRDDRLVVISPIKLNPELIRQIDALGRVCLIIAPNRYHHLFAKEFKQQYPEALLWAARGLQEKRPDLPIDRIIEDFDGNIDGELFYQQFAGINAPSLKGADPLNEVVFYHPSSRTLIITDIAFHFDETAAWETRLAGKLLGGYKALEPTVLEKWFMGDRASVEKSIRSVLQWDFERVIMAHGTTIEVGGKRRLKEGYERFLGVGLG
jgi:hypothetical protein